MTARRFPPPWSVEDPDPKLDRQCFIVRDANERPLAYVYFEDEMAPAVTEAALFGFSPKTTPVCGFT
jgi:hypothetical protein